MLEIPEEILIHLFRGFRSCGEQVKFSDPSVGDHDRDEAE